MRMLLLLSLCAAVVMSATGANAEAEDRPPEWAYPVNPPGFKPPPDDGKPRQVPDSSAVYNVAQTRDRFLAPDWHPGDHPPMPEIVAQGRKPEVFACGFCHRADGPGGPENASLAGLPAAYIIHQMADFRNGLRKTSVPERGPPQLMIALAKAASDEEIRISAQYFAALKPRSTIKVIESDSVPKTVVAGWFLADAGAGEHGGQPRPAAGPQDQLGGVLRPGEGQQGLGNVVADDLVVGAAHRLGQPPLGGQRGRIGAGQPVGLGDVHGQQVAA